MKIQTGIRTTLLAMALAAPVAVAVGASPFSRVPAPDILSPDAAQPDDGLSLTETYCDLRETVAGTLSHDFAEAPRLAALTGMGMTMELWTSDLVGTWTLVHHAADGISCIVTSGTGWQADGDPVVLLDQALAEAVHQS